MYKKVLKRTTLIVFCTVLGCIIGCTTIDNQEQDLFYLLQSSFEKIYLAKYGLNYPHTKNSLSRCIEYDDRQCLDCYHQVTEGKNTIESLADSKSLVTTLDIIERACLSKNQRISNFVCYGGIMSLYFYNIPEQDAKIRSRIKKYPKKVRNKIFNSNFFWYHNRPDFDVWTTYLSTADVDWKHKARKQHISELFKRSIENLDEEPWVFR